MGIYSELYQSLDSQASELPASMIYVDVVYSMLINVEKILRNLGQQDQWITVDELVYKLVGDAQLQNITICTGGFNRVKKKHFLRSTAVTLPKWNDANDRKR